MGENIRSLILQKNGDHPTPRAELLLYEASRAQHVDRVIAPQLKSGNWVLCDRFTASSIAFQSGGRDIQEKEVEWLNHFATCGLEADLTVLLDLSIEESQRRRQVRSLLTGEPEDRIEAEKEDFHQKVRESFLRQAATTPSENGQACLSANSKWVVLDARRSVEELEKELFLEMTQRSLWK